MLKKAIFKLTGLDCPVCVINIDGELEDSGKIAFVKTNYARSETEVRFNPAEITENEILALIKRTGYTAQVK